MSTRKNHITSDNAFPANAPPQSLFSCISLVKLCHHKLWRTLCVLIAATVGWSASASGFIGIYAAAQNGYLQWERVNRGANPDPIQKPYLGDKPGRDPQGRGGVWSPQRRHELESVSEYQGMYASVAAHQPFLAHSLSVAPQSGGSYPWEGSASAPSGKVNSGNGNKVTELHLFS